MEAIVTSTSVSDKGAIGSIRFKRDIMVTMAVGSGPAGAETEFNDFFLTTDQATSLVHQLLKRMRENTGMLKPSGIELILEEREEQLTKHNFDTLRDQSYINDELVDAAMQYIGGDLISCWPDSWDDKAYKPGNRIEELKRAGALLAAEIDRLQNKKY